MAEPERVLSTKCLLLRVDMFQEIDQVFPLHVSGVVQNIQPWNILSVHQAGRIVFQCRIWYMIAMTARSQLYCMLDRLGYPMIIAAHCSDG